MKKICVLGSTGSIGRQALQVIKDQGYELTAISGNENVDLLENQIREFKPMFCAVGNEKSAADLKLRVKDTGTAVLSGIESITEMSYNASADMLLNALSGSCGIEPSLAAIDSKKDIAMANKEPIVAAGDIILSRAKKNKVKIVPVDSEHSAIFQCINGKFNSYKYISRIIITASGGPFFGKKREDLKNVTPKEAISHPTWNMGKKISVDSATLMNKGLELIEAVRLFGVPADKIDICVHRQTLVHSMVEFVDKTVLAQLGRPDMRSCIQFAMTYPERKEGLCSPLDFKSGINMTFEPCDEETFSLLALARKAIEKGGNLPCVINAANEAAVHLFLNGKISFLDIFDVVFKAYEACEFIKEPTLFDILESDKWAKQFVLRA